MFYKERSVPITSLSGHQAVLEPHEADKLNIALIDVMGMDAISDTLEKAGFKLGSKFNKNNYLLLRKDNTEIKNAYLDGDHEMMRIKLLQPISFKYLAKHPSALFNPSTQIEREELEELENE